MFSSELDWEETADHYKGMVREIEQFLLHYHGFTIDMPTQDVEKLIDYIRTEGQVSLF